MFVAVRVEMMLCCSIFRYETAPRPRVVTEQR